MDEEQAREEPREQGEHFTYKPAVHNANLNNMRLNGELCDVTIKISEREFRTHKVVLAASLRYFRALFSTDFQESHQDTISVTTVNQANLEALINFAYTGEINFNNDNALSLLRDVDYMNEEDIKEACIGYLCINMRPEIAIPTLQFGYNISCTPLKEAAKQSILSNFAELSFTEAFLNLDFAPLREVLSVEEVYNAEPRGYFERVVQWIVHDLANRRQHLKDLLSLVCVVELTLDYLVGYLYENVNPENDAIIRDIMVYYRECNEREMPRRNRENLQTLLITIDRAMLSHIQIYNFETNSWSLLYTNIDHVHYTVSTVFKKQLFIIGGRTDVECVADVRIYDFATSEVRQSAPMSVARRDCGVASSSNHLYVCGGRGNHGVALNLVERFDVRLNRWETLPPMNVARYSSAVIVFQGCLYVIGGSSGDVEELNVVERYDPASRQWTILEPMLHPRVSLAVAALNGKLYACGGWDKNSVEVYDPRSRRWEECTQMQRKRDSFLVIEHEGRLMAIGGDTDRQNITLERYNANSKEWEFLDTPGLHTKYVTGVIIKV